MLRPPSVRPRKDPHTGGALTWTLAREHSMINPLQIMNRLKAGIESWQRSNRRIHISHLPGRDAM